MQPPWWDARLVQASRLGRPDLDAVFVPHPIQDRTADEITARADAAIDEIVARLTGHDVGDWPPR